MAVTYKPIDGEQVSAQWHVALLDCRAAGVQFNVNEGHRSMARQQQLVDQLGVWTSTNNHGAARPSANAPHIRTGRFDHAVDLNNSSGVARWLRAHGIRCAFTVPGEPWHLEANASDLAAYHARRAPRVIRKGSRPGADIKRLQVYLRAGGYLKRRKVTRHYDLAARRAVRAFQKRHGLRVDGVVGPNTILKLKAAAAARKA